jgi:hypothetical protein
MTSPTSLRSAWAWRSAGICRPSSDRRLALVLNGRLSRPRSGSAARGSFPNSTVAARHAVRRVRGSLATAADTKAAQRLPLIFPNSFGSRSPSVRVMARGVRQSGIAHGRGDRSGRRFAEPREREPFLAVRAALTLAGLPQNAIFGVIRISITPGSRCALASFRPSRSAGSGLNHANKQSHASHEATHAKRCGDSATTNENRGDANTEPEIWFIGVIVWAR